MTDGTDDLSAADRRVIYRARRGLKELDIYFDPYARERYATAQAAEKAAFAELVEQEEPDLLDWFMGVDTPPEHLTDIIRVLKHYRHGC